MSASSVGLDILVILGGALFYGIRSEVGKFLLRITFKLIIKPAMKLFIRMFVRSERQIAIFLHHYNEAAKKDRR